MKSLLLFARSSFVGFFWGDSWPEAWLRAITRIATQLRSRADIDFDFIRVPHFKTLMAADAAAYLLISHSLSEPLPIF